MRKFEKIKINTTESFTVPWPVENLTVMNPTKQTVMIRTGSPAIPEDVSDADVFLPPFSSLNIPVTGTEFGMRLGAPEAGADPIGQTYAWLTFTAGEAPPMLGGVSFSQVSIDSAVEITTAEGGSLPVEIQNASMQIEPATGTVFNMNFASADVSLPVTGQQTVLVDQTITKGATAFGSVSLPAGTVALALYVDKSIQEAELMLRGRDASNVVLSEYADYNNLAISSPFVVPVSQNDDNVYWQITNKQPVTGSGRFILCAVVGPSLSIAANINQQRPFPSSPAYDNIVRYYDRTARTSHALTKRWEYEVPANWQAIVDSVNLFCDKSTAIDQMTCFIAVTDTAHNIVAYAAELWSITSNRQTLALPLGIILNEGEHLEYWTFSSDAASRTLMGSAMIRELRKVKVN